MYLRSTAMISRLKSSTFSFMLGMVRGFLYVTHVQGPTTVLEELCGGLFSVFWDQINRWCIVKDSIMDKFIGQICRYYGLGPDCYIQSLILVKNHDEVSVATFRADNFPTYIYENRFKWILRQEQCHLSDASSQLDSVSSKFENRSTV